MLTEAEIKQSYKKAHDILTEQYYVFGLWEEEEFVKLHGQNWADMEAELIAGGFMEAPKPVRDLAAEIDEFRARIVQLKGI